MNEPKLKWASMADQKAHWTRKDDLYAAYLADMHKRQQDPEYIKSYSQWLDSQLEKNDGRDLIVELIEKYGFVIQDTGGGCQWLRRELSDELYMVITDGEAGLPELTARMYIITKKCGEPICQSDLMTLDEMLDAIGQTFDAK